MELTTSKVWRVKAEAGSWKDGSWKKANCLEKQKVCKDADIYELELKIMIGNMGGKNEKGPQSHDAKGKSQAKHAGTWVSGDGKTPFEQMNKEGTGSRAGAQVKSVLTQNQFTNPLPWSDVEALPSGSSTSGISVSDYLVLLKSLRINLPSGVLTPKVIRLSQNAGVIQKAQDIVKKLESFKLKFNSVPRLGCRETKKSLSLKDNQKVLEITEMIFFEKTEDCEEDLRAQWKKNVSNSNCGFRFRDKYKTMAISTPALYATTQTRSWKHLAVGDKFAKISAGVTVNVGDIWNRDYCDESALWTTSSPQKFGKYFQNPADEHECLKFYHELQEIGANKKVKYSKGNKVEYGFLSGRLDFLAEVEKSEKTVIECKGTTGDMVGKVFTKPKNGSRRAHLIETHEYCYQVQAYMYILNRAEKQTQSFTSERAVMVIRHYHKNGREPRDFYWNYLRKNEAIQQKIDELRVFCEEEVLACFLAVLKLIFQKDN